MSKSLIAFDGRLQEERKAQCAHQPDCFAATCALTVTVLFVKLYDSFLDSQHGFGLINAIGSKE